MENYQLVLNHSGVKGMKWGIRRYQNKDGSLTAAGRKRYGVKETYADTETPEQKKARILSSHDAKLIYKNKNLFSDKEIQDAYNRLNNERNIKNLIPEEVSRGKQILDKYTDVSKTIKSVVDSSSDIYNSFIKAKGIIDAISGKTVPNTNNKKK